MPHDYANCKALSQATKEALAADAPTRTKMGKRKQKLKNLREQQKNAKKHGEEI